MIVVDTNVLAAFYLPSPSSEVVTSLFEIDPEWVAPHLWRSEFRNVLATFMRQGRLELDCALELQAAAEELLMDREYALASGDVLRFAKESGCSAYDSEFIALASYLDLKLVTLDRQLLNAYPKRALEPAAFNASAR